MFINNYIRFGTCGYRRVARCDRYIVMSYEFGYAECYDMIVETSVALIVRWNRL